MLANLKKEDQIVDETLKEPKDGTVDTISALFDERDQKDFGERAKLFEKDAQNTPESKEALKEEKETEVSPQKSTAKDDVEAPELKSLQAELEKTRKAVTDTQKYSHQNARKLKSALKIARNLIEEGALSEAEAKGLVDSLENGVEEDVELSSYNSHPFGKVLKIANTELENIRKYSDDELLDDKIKAFDYFLSLAPADEIQDALDDLTELSDDPVKLTKKMLSIGKRYYDESYKDIKAAGGVHEYIAKKNKDIDKLNNNIDKLTKKLSQYEDFDKPRYRINEMGESNDDTVVQDTISALVDERDRVTRR